MLSLARHATAAQLVRSVRAYRGVVAPACAAEQGGPERHVTWSYADDGSLVLRARLPADEGAVVLAALDAGVDRLIAERDASAETPSPAPAHASAEASAPAPEHASAEAPGRDSVSAEALAPASSMEAPSIAELRADALVLMADTLLARGPAGRSGGERHQLLVHVDPAALRDGALDARCELSDGAPLAPETARRLACDAAIVPVFERRQNH